MIEDGQECFDFRDWGMKNDIKVFPLLDFRKCGLSKLERMMQRSLKKCRTLRVGSQYLQILLLKWNFDFELCKPTGN